MMKYRQRSNRTNIRLRFQSLSTNEHLKAHSFRITAVHLYRWAAACPIPTYREILRRRSLIAFYMYLRMVKQSASIPRPLRRDCLIANFTESQCFIFFGIRQLDLIRLRDALRFRGVARLENRCAMDMEEMLLAMVHRVDIWCVLSTQRMELASGVCQLKMSTQLR